MLAKFLHIIKHIKTFSSYPRVTVVNTKGERVCNIFFPTYSFTFFEIIILNLILLFNKHKIKSTKICLKFRVFIFFV